MHIYKIVYIKTFKIAPTCCDPNHLQGATMFLAKVTFLQYGKHKPCFNPDSLIICVQNSILTIVF